MVWEDPKHNSFCPSEEWDTVPPSSGYIQQLRSSLNPIIMEVLYGLIYVGPWQLTGSLAPLHSWWLEGMAEISKPLILWLVPLTISAQPELPIKIHPIKLKPRYTERGLI